MNTVPYGTVHAGRSAHSGVSDGPTPTSPGSLNNNGEDTMKTIASIVLALTVLAGVVAPAAATDAESFFSQLDRESR
jgi:hypothetical protein